MLTRREDVHQRIRIHCERGNHAFPLSELQAAVLLPQLDQLAARNEVRRRNVGRLLEALTGVPLLTPVLDHGGSGRTQLLQIGLALRFSGGRSPRARNRRAVRRRSAHRCRLSRFPTPRCAVLPASRAAGAQPASRRRHAAAAPSRTAGDRRSDGAAGGGYRQSALCSGGVMAIARPVCRLGKAQPRSACIQLGPVSLCGTWYCRRNDAPREASHDAQGVRVRGPRVTRGNARCRRLGTLPVANAVPLTAHGLSLDNALGQIIWLAVQHLAEQMCTVGPARLAGPT